MGKDWPRSHGQDGAEAGSAPGAAEGRSRALCGALHRMGSESAKRSGASGPKQTCGAGVTILICPPAPWPEQPQGTVVLCSLLPLCPASLPVTSACHVGNNGLTPGMVGIQNSRSQRARSQALRPSSARPRPRPLLCARLAPA